jgi:O-antigen/teichoic acid export membrane protein
VSARKQSFWALSDQGISSIGNFFTAVYLARVLGASEYGLFALLYGGIVLANSLHAGLVVYPMQVLAAQEQSRAGLVFRSGMRMTILVGAMLGLVVGALTFVLHRPALFGSVFFATLAWQLQETARRALLSELRFKGALIGDCVSYLGQALLIFSLIRRGANSPAGVCWIVGLTSLCALGIQLTQLRLSFRRRARDVRYQEFWELGNWATLTNFAGMLPTVQGLLWIANIGAGAVAAGILQKVANSTGVLHPLLFTMGNLLVPAIANAESEGGLSKARDVSVHYVQIFGSIIFPYIALLLVSPEFVFRVMYGGLAPPIGFDFVMRLFAAAYLAIFGAQILGSWLRARLLPKHDFAANLLSAITMLAAGLPLVRFMGVNGAAIAFFLACMARLIYQALGIAVFIGSPAQRKCATGTL